MPPTLALLLGWGFIGFVLRHELRRSRDTVTGALWLPTIWVAIISSRPLSLWLSHVGLPLGPTSVEEGSPLDAAFYSILILLGVMALSNRRLDWAALVSSNKCLAVFLIFAASSLFWSDMPFVTFKRFLRTCGHLVMVLVVLTEPQPVEAFKALVRRIAYVLLPLALVFIKYFPHLASRYDQWTGAQIISGVSLTKNMFGQLCLITGLVLAWIVLGQLRRKSKIEDRRGFAIDAYMVFLAVHLIYRVNSKWVSSPSWVSARFSSWTGRSASSTP
jgi:exopolysaccharide production protein ExoQ